MNFYSCDASKLTGKINFFRQFHSRREDLRLIKFRRRILVSKTEKQLTTFRQQIFKLMVSLCFRLICSLIILDFLIALMKLGERTKRCQPATSLGRIL